MELRKTTIEFEIKPRLYKGERDCPFDKGEDTSEFDMFKSEIWELERDANGGIVRILTERVNQDVLKELTDKNPVEIGELLFLYYLKARHEDRCERVFNMDAEDAKFKKEYWDWYVKQPFVE